MIRQLNEILQTVDEQDDEELGNMIGDYGIDDYNGYNINNMTRNQMITEIKHHLLNNEVSSNVFYGFVVADIDEFDSDAGISIPLDDIIYFNAAGGVGGEINDYTGNILVGKNEFNNATNERREAIINHFSEIYVGYNIGE